LTIEFVSGIKTPSLKSPPKRNFSKILLNSLELFPTSVTLSFWVKATKTGIYSVSAKPSSNNASCVLEYTINQADTWEFKTLIFPAPSASNGTWDYTNGWGIEFLWSLAQGSTYKTSTLGQWRFLYF
jgi:hypothetical protein